MALNGGLLKLTDSRLFSLPSFEYFTLFVRSRAGSEMSLKNCCTRESRDSVGGGGDGGGSSERSSPEPTRYHRLSRQNEARGFDRWIWQLIPDKNGNNDRPEHAGFPFSSYNMYTSLGRRYYQQVDGCYCLCLACCCCFYDSRRLIEYCILLFSSSANGTMQLIQRLDTPIACIASSLTKADSDFCTPVRLFLHSPVGLSGFRSVDGPCQLVPCSEDGTARNQRDPAANLQSSITDIWSRRYVAFLCRIPKSLCNETG
jgi:hypothetical protein